MTKIQNKTSIPRTLALTVLLTCMINACADGLDPPESTRAIFIGAGDFIMGDAAPDPCGRFAANGNQITLSPDIQLASENTAHTVSVSAFCLDEHEVTVEQYRHCVARGVCPQPELRNVGNRDEAGYQKEYYSDPDRFGRYPVAGISLEGAKTYCAFRFGRLPREEEWAFAARSRGNRQHIVSDPALLPLIETGCDRDGQYRGAIAMGECSESVRMVASSSLDFTEQGVFDLAGNVAEWTSNPFDPLAYCAAEQPAGLSLTDLFDVKDDVVLVKPNLALLSEDESLCNEKLFVHQIDGQARYAGGCLDDFEMCAQACTSNEPGTRCLSDCFAQFGTCAAPCLFPGVSTTCARVLASDQGCRPSPWCLARGKDLGSRTRNPTILTSNMRGRAVIRGGHFQSSLSCDARASARRPDGAPEPVVGFRCAYDRGSPRCPGIER